MTFDILFLERNCPHCGTIKAKLDMTSVVDDDFRGESGQELYVFSAQSNKASLELLRTFNLTGYSIPLLKMADGTVLTKTKKILEYLDEQKMSD